MNAKYGAVMNRNLRGTIRQSWLDRQFSVFVYFSDVHPLTFIGPRTMRCGRT